MQTAPAHRFARVAALAVVLLLLPALAACSADNAAESAADGSAAEQQDASDGPAPDEVAAAAGGGKEAAAGDTAGGTGAGDGGTSVGDTGTALPVAVTGGDRIIKEGTLTLEVPDDAFDAAFEQVITIARRLGGDVTASETSTTGDDRPTGSLTVRVPVESYEDLLVGVGEVGDVRQRRVTARDVSAEFVDLEARRRQLQAQEAFYLGLLEEATTVEDAIHIRGELDSIQTEVEQLTGRLDLLEDRTTFSTLTVQLFEAGGPAPSGGTAPVRGLARYWQTGLDALVAAVGTMVVIAVGGLPLFLVAGVVLLGIRVLRRRPSDVPSA